MKRLHWLVIPAALSGGLATTVMADDGTLSDSQLDRILERASQYGFAQYEEISLDDGERVEIEGWRDDGWHLDVDMLATSGELVHEEQRKSQIPGWSLSGDELRQALASAREAGLQRFGQLDVDDNGHLEIEGYDTHNREVEIRMNRNDFSVIGVDHD
ncbi:PepSY domain-containing protein [Halomonas sp. McH1-25]|uniref:PepSY domain-containing protein n=1 Tax=unclassified Halomonas TaxID=2609666 RepID=UPI001EF5A7D8|nr:MULTISPECIES: PepSY domain-containing protein [unclassified Halomonas]MCG7601273.1 PepSY domain-containing protein [Halomonas sp. McH1-25]MCP1343276.1 PepSY domain-containing protein [Halomonas sp. FL8]MCP1360733.1 PepSY domain-containing protein [Halomonas sp. BBD45]MCP1366369.1 PepSY domain-containing protein [Halomonas sp. BBD48]